MTNQHDLPEIITASETAELLSLFRRKPYDNGWWGFHGSELMAWLAAGGPSAGSELATSLRSVQALSTSTSPFDGLRAGLSTGLSKGQALLARNPAGEEQPHGAQ